MKYFLPIKTNNGTVAVSMWDLKSVSRQDGATETTIELEDGTVLYTPWPVEKVLDQAMNREAMYDRALRRRERALNPAK